MRPRTGSARVWGAKDVRWTLGGGIYAEIARDDDRGNAPGQTDHRGECSDESDSWAAAHHVDYDASVPVTCWCEETIVSVPLELVRAGLTYACDTEECRRREEQACQPSA